MLFSSVRFNVIESYDTILPQNIINMDINEFIEKFAEIFDDTEVSNLKPETKFRDLDEWSSLSALGLIALADEEFDVELKAADMRNAETIQDIFNILNKKAG